MPVTRLPTHFENYILQIRRLCSWPVNACCLTTSRYASQINNKVSNLSKENIRACPIQVLTPIGIAIYDTETREVCCCFEHWWIVRIPNELSVVEVDDRG